jgi:AraC family transcriptional regulator
MPPTSASSPSQASLSVGFDHHPPGEYAFTPKGLALSVCLVRCNVETLFDGRSWRGLSIRGDINVMPRGGDRVFRHHESCRFALIGIDERQIAVDGDNRGGNRVIRPQGWLRDAPLRHAIDALLAESTFGPPTALFRNAVGAAIIARLRELDGVDSATPRALRHELPEADLSKVIEFMEARLADDLSVAELASIARLSPAHFSTLFRNATGEPPHRYHTRLRVERARRLLERGATPSDASLAVGFFDQSHLARHMRRLLGVSPGRLRRFHSPKTKNRPEE